jgi:hypothetical protein
LTASHLGCLGNPGPAGQATLLSHGPLVGQPGDSSALGLPVGHSSGPAGRLVRLAPWPAQPTHGLARRLGRPARQKELPIDCFCFEVPKQTPMPASFFEVPQRGRLFRFRPQNKLQCQFTLRCYTWPEPQVCCRGARRLELVGSSRQRDAGSQRRNPETRKDITSRGGDETPDTTLLLVHAERLKAEVQVRLSRVVR